MKLTAHPSIVPILEMIGVCSHAPLWRVLAHKHNFTLQRADLCMEGLLPPTPPRARQSTGSVQGIMSFLWSTLGSLPSSEPHLPSFPTLWQRK